MRLEFTWPPESCRCQRPLGRQRKPSAICASLRKSLSRRGQHFPFLHATGSLTGGRDKERSWNKKIIEIKDRLGFARNVSVLTEEVQNADTVFVVDLSTLLPDQSAGAEDLPREMEEN